LAVLRGDRFILRDESGIATVGGGVVLDPEADRKGFHSAARREFLAADLAALDDAESAIKCHLVLKRIIRLNRLLRNSRFSASEVSGALNRLVHAGHVRVLCDLAVSVAEVDRLLNLASAAIDSEHRANPAKPGLELSKLNDLLGWPEFQPELTQAVLQSLSGIVKVNGVVRRMSHQPAAPAALNGAAARLASLLRSRKFDPPSRKELAPDKPAQEAIRALVKAGQAIELSNDLILLTETFKEAERTVRDFLTRRGRASVSELRDVLKSSRRVLVPLLEKFDQKGVTKRVGDHRIAG
jgi:selenocysteine-specific elongation factor